MRKYSVVLISIVAGLVLAGCQTPVGVVRVDAESVHRTLTRNILSSDRPSIFTENVLHQYGLADQFEEDPAAALAELHSNLLRLTFRSDLVFALAELSFLHAERAERREYYLASALYAFLFLFPDDPARIPGPFDPRFRLAADLYNRGITSGFASEDRSSMLIQSGVYELPFAQLHVSVPQETLRWGDRALTHFTPVAELEVRGLRNRYRMPGFGAPLAAEQSAMEPGTALSIEHLKAPVTAVLMVDGLLQQIASGQVDASLEVHVAFDRKRISINGRSVPLEIESTAVLAASLNESPVWETELKGFFLGNPDPNRATRLYALEPYRPGRIPVVFVHGTASSAGRWADMVNDLINDRCIRSRFQFWFFTYDTGNVVLYSANLLRDTLQDIVSELDPDKSDPALREMVVIGHSQGGLLTKLVSIDPGNTLWDNFSHKPLEAMQLPDDTRDMLRNAFFFEPLPFIKRVVYIATPHRGSYVAGNWVAHQLSRFVSLPGRVVTGISDVLTKNRDKLNQKFFKPKQVVRVGSVYDMTPGSFLATALPPFPVAPGIASHSIIAVDADVPVEEGSDGVVAYSSAHLDDVDSELVVRSGHSCQAHPDSIEEVRRILLLHAGVEC